MLYYLKLCISQHIDVRNLREKIKNREYDRLSDEVKNKMISESDLNAQDLVPNPILIKNRKNVDIVTEKVLHQLIMDDISSFLRELGHGFSFVGSQYKIKIDDRYNYVDLLLFNIKYNAYVVVELKVTKFKAEYIAQVKKYMNYIDKNIKGIYNNDTIGILICRRVDKFVIEYCSDERIIVREYRLL